MLFRSCLVNYLLLIWQYFIRLSKELYNLKGLKHFKNTSVLLTESFLYVHTLGQKGAHQISIFQSNEQTETILIQDLAQKSTSTKTFSVTKD